MKANTNTKTAADTSQSAGSFVPLSCDPEIKMLLERINQRKAEEAEAVKHIKCQGKISKSDLVRVFQEERGQIEDLLLSLEGAIEFAIEVCEHPGAKTFPDDPEDKTERTGCTGAAAYELKRYQKFRERVRQHLSAVHAAIMKL